MRRNPQLDQVARLWGQLLTLHYDRLRRWRGKPFQWGQPILQPKPKKRKAK